MNERSQLQKRAKALGIKATLSNQNLLNAINSIENNVNNTLELSNKYKETLKLYKEKNIVLVEKHRKYMLKKEQLEDAIDYLKPKALKYILSLPLPNNNLNGYHYDFIASNPYVTLIKIGSITTPQVDDISDLETSFTYDKIDFIKGYTMPTNERVYLLTNVKYESDYNVASPNEEGEQLLNALISNATNSQFLFDVMEIKVRLL